MARGRQRQRHRAEDSDTSDDEFNHKTSETVIDPKIALQLADLGNRARDALTAHDRERDRRVNFAQLNSTRKCNQRGSLEAENAAVNQTQLSGWNSFGGTDSTTNLDDIAKGQYHRQATAQKVQAEVRQLRIEGRDVNAESVDVRRGHSTRPNTRGSGNHNRGNFQPGRVSNDGSRPQDPAVDETRVYRYKDGSQHDSSKSKPARGSPSNRGGRGGRSAGRGDHATQVARAHPVASNTTYEAATPSSKIQRGEMGARAARQRKIQDRPWPPVALFANPEPSLSVSDANLSFHLQVSPAESVLPIVGSASKTIKQPQFVEKTAAELTSPQSLGVSLLLSSPLPSSPVQRNEKLAEIKEKLAEDFSNWFPKAVNVARQVSSSVVHPKVEKTYSAIPAPTNPVRIIHEELGARTALSNQLSEGQRTDGRLTPITFTNVSDASDERYPEQTHDSRPLSVKSNTSLSKGQLVLASKSAAGDLMDIEIPEVEREAMASSRTPVFKPNTGVDAMLQPMQSRTEVRADTGGDMLALDGINTATKSELHDTSGQTMVTTPAVLRAPPESNVETQNRVQKLSEAEIGSKALGKSIVASTSALQLRSPNVTHRVDNAQSKWAFPLVLSQSTASVKSQSVEIPSAALGSAATSALGDGCTRPRQYVPSAESSSSLGDESNLRRRGPPATKAGSSLGQSRFAVEQPQVSRMEESWFKSTPIGPGYQQLLIDLEDKDLTVQTQRRPYEPAFVRAASVSAFTQYREQAQDASTSDDEL